MTKVLLWVGLYLGMPAAATWLSSIYLTIADQFLVFFVFSVGALLIGFLPRLAGPPRS